MLSPLLIPVPASVMVLDLVKHSTRDPKATRAIQAILNDALTRACGYLSIHHAKFTYRGDGYVCALLGPEAGQMLDFANVLIPDLEGLLSECNQTFRVAFDFGLLHLQHNIVTNNFEHFDAATVGAARLEPHALPGKPICTDTFRAVFSPLYQSNFGSSALLIKTKDRDITAFELMLLDWRDVRIAIKQFLLSISPNQPGEASNADSKCSVLVVDDESAISVSIKSILRGQYSVERAADAMEAWRLINTRDYDCIITDNIMPGMTGIELSEMIMRRDPSQTLIMLTGYGTWETETHFYMMGGLFFLTKPLEIATLRQVVAFATSERLRSLLKLERFPPEHRIELLQNLVSLLEVQCRVIELAKGADPICSLLRHKSRHILDEFSASIRPGVSLKEAGAIALRQLRSIERLARCSLLSSFDRDPDSAGGLLENPDTVIRASVMPNIQRMFNELPKLHPKISFTFNVDIPHIVIARLHIPLLLPLLVTELIDNACAAVGKEGSVMVVASFFQSRSELHIAVVDSGPGVPPDLQHRIFEAGMSTHGVGRGIGLAVLQHAVLQQNGKIQYERRDQTTFSVMIPIPHL